MSYLNKEFKKYKTVYFCIIVLHFVFLILAGIGVIVLNDNFTQDQKPTDIFIINIIFIAAAIVTPIFTYFGLSQLRKRKIINQLDQRLRISKEDEKFFKNNLSYILYYFLHGIINLPSAILGFLVIGNTVINSGKHEIIFFIIGFILIITNLIYTCLNIPSKLKLLSFMKSCKVSEKDLNVLRDIV